MRHSLTRLYVHAVWSTWRRHPLITPVLQPQIYACMQRKAGRLGCEVIAIGGIADHIHIVVRFPPTLSVAELVGRMKGASSHFVTHVLKHETAFKWQGAYGAFTLGERGLPTVRHYVLNQEAHHRNGTTHPLLESTSME